MIFSDSQRSDATRKRNRESDFAFMDRSARPAIATVREFLEDCARMYPSDELAEPIARIQSGNDTHFKSASFELILHASLVRLGYKLQPHPQLQNGSTARPDFLAVTPDGQEFYLEAVLASEDNGGEPAADARIGTALDALATANHSNFMVSVESDGIPTTQPSGNRLKTAVLKWLDTLNPDEVQSTIGRDGLDAAPTLEWAHEDWQLTLRPIPLRPDRRGKSMTLIGVLDDSGAFIDAWTPIRNAIKYKGSKYGELGKPFLVAVNFDSFHLDRIDEMQALFGEEQFVFNTVRSEAEPRFQRAPNGAWYGKKGPQYTRASGAWIFNDLSPYTVANRRQTIYLNPWASHPLPDALTQLPHAVARDQKMQWSDGVSLSQIFGLRDGWPE
jgi:hypothetical protein